MAGEKRSRSITENPLVGGSHSNWRRLRRANHPIDRPYLWRARYISLMTVLTWPLRRLQNLFFAARLRRVEITEPPLFILGHYRSGTTYLQNLLRQDERWGFVSTTQAVVPGAFLLGGFVRVLLGLFLAKTRPMDNMAQSPTLPEEPEHAIANLSPYSFYHGLCFPRRWRHYFDRYVLRRDLSEAEAKAWREVYESVLRAATYASGGRRLMIKNPPDMARLEAILEIFPDARFVHLYRNPFVIYPSIENFYSACLDDWQLQDLEPGALRELIFDLYSEMMGAFERDKHLIPEGHLVEVRFEDLEKQPLDEMRRIYQTLDLPDFDVAEPAIQAHIDSQKSYQKNRYRLDPELTTEIKERWATQIEQWGYAPPPE